MLIQSNVSLRNLNTFGLDADARYFVNVQSVDELMAVLRDPQWRETPKFILGGGSNILLTKDIEALVIHPGIRGISTIGENEETVVLAVGAGEVWHDFVMHCVGKGYGGVENLAHSRNGRRCAHAEYRGLWRGDQKRDRIGGSD